LEIRALPSGFHPLEKVQGTAHFWGTFVKAPAKIRHGNFNPQSFGALRGRGGVRQLQKEKFPKGKS